MRSLLAVPATNPRFLEKGAASHADAVFIDLEDAVIPELKVEGRAKAVEAIDGLDWGDRILSVRVNDLGTEWGEADIAAVAKCARLDRILLPKSETPGDIEKVVSILGDSRIRIDALVETAKGVANAEAIAASSPRLASMLFGPGDYTLDLGVLEAAPYLDFAMARIANAARAYGLAPVDGPFFGITDTEGLRAACRKAAAMGYEGKMAIHPTQVEIAHEVFTPSAQQVAWAEEVLQAMAAAGEQGRGAVKTKDGKMIDLVHIKIARKVIERAGRRPTHRRET